MRAKRSEHSPKGDPCSLCGLPSLSHRVKHRPDGEPCSCGLPPDRHRTRTAGEKKRWKRKGEYYVGLDGEGQGRAPHVYFLLAAAAEDGRRWFVENPAGLGTEECLDFILSLPLQARVFGYSIGYDLTKMLKDLPPKLLYLLVRLDARRGEHGPRAVKWGKYK